MVRLTQARNGHEREPRSLLRDIPPALPALPHGCSVYGDTGPVWAYQLHKDKTEFLGVRLPLKCEWLASGASLQIIGDAKRRDAENAERAIFQKMQATCSRRGFLQLQPLHWWATAEPEVKPTAHTTRITEISTDTDTESAEDTGEAKGGKSLRTLIEERLTDTGNADRLVTKYGDVIRYVRGTKRGDGWLVWDDVKWRENASSDVERLCRDVIKSIPSSESIVYAQVGGDPRKYTNFLRKSLNAPDLRNMMRAAQSFKQIEIESAALDADAFLFGCSNVVIDLRTGLSRNHRREDLITKISPVAYKPGAIAPRFIQFLHEVFEGHPDVPPYFQKLCGYAATADTSEAALVICYGPSGSNGKSTLLRILRYVMGDYAIDVSASWLMRRRSGEGENATPGLATLAGARFGYVSEIESGHELNEALIKNLTGGDSVQARRLYGDFFSLRPTCKFFIGTNHKPAIKDGGAAFWRRVKPIPFTVHFGESRQDKQLSAKLTAESEGILAWIVEGARRWYSEGLGELPASVRALLTEYRTEMEPLTDFIESNIAIASAARCRTLEVYQTYLKWRDSADMTPSMRQQQFSDALKRSIPGLASRKIGGVMWYVGINLRPSDMPQDVWDAIRG